jgi:hypothetical protein
VRDESLKDADTLFGNYLSALNEFTANTETVTRLTDENRSLQELMRSIAKGLARSLQRVAAVKR